MGGMSGVTFLPFVVVGLAWRGGRCGSWRNWGFRGTWVHACPGGGLDSLSTGNILGLFFYFGSELCCPSSQTVQLFICPGDGAVSLVSQEKWYLGTSLGTSLADGILKVKNPGIMTYHFPLSSCTICSLPCSSSPTFVFIFRGWVDMAREGSYPRRNCGTSRAIQAPVQLKVGQLNCGSDWPTRDHKFKSSTSNFLSPPQTARQPQQNRKYHTAYTTPPK